MKNCLYIFVPWHGAEKGKRIYIIMFDIGSVKYDSDKPAAVKR